LYLFAINSFSNNRNNNANKNITLMNLKKTLLDFEYENSIMIKCVNDSYDCYVFVDNELQEEKIKGLFKEKPTVYSYSLDLEKIDFLDLELNQLERQEIVFEYGCKKNSKCNEWIVEVDDKLFIFNDIFKKPKLKKEISEIDEYFNSKIAEVRDAL
jgi:hypothetical protein